MPKNRSVAQCQDARPVVATVRRVIIVRDTHYLQRPTLQRGKQDGVVRLHVVCYHGNAAISTPESVNTE